MVEKKATQRPVTTTFNHASDRAVIAYRRRPAAARSVQRKPTAAGFKPLPDQSVLIVVAIRTGHVLSKPLARLALRQLACKTSRGL